MLNRSKLLAAAFLFAVFGAGGVVGGVVSAAWGDSPRRVSSEPHHRTSYAERLQAELVLSVLQRDSIDAILARRKEQMDAIWRDIRPRFETLRTAIRTEIMAQLTDDQRTRYQELIERSDSIRALRGSRGGRHGKK